VHVLSDLYYHCVYINSYLSVIIVITMEPDRVLMALHVSMCVVEPSHSVITFSQYFALLSQCCCIVITKLYKLSAGGEVGKFMTGSLSQAT